MNDSDSTSYILPGSSQGVDDDTMVFVTNSIERMRITSAGNIGIGTSSPSQALSVQGNALFSGTISAANLTATGTVSVAGAINLASTTAASTGLITQNSVPFLHSYGLNNFFAGMNAGNLTLSSGLGRNTGVGVTALTSLTTGNTNTAVGFESMKANTSGNGNTALGYQTLLNNLTGTQNVAIGNSALKALTSGTQNVAVGGGLFQVSTSTGNTSVGTNAGNVLADGTNNTFLGAYAGGHPVSGGKYSDENTIVGAYSGYDIGGSKNILLGSQIGNTNNSFDGSNNIVIGYNINLPNTTDSGMLDIGNFLYATGLGTTGNTVNSSALLGIGTTSPYAKLSVTNTGLNPSFVVEDRNSDSSPFIIDNDGYTGIGTTSLTAKLTVEGNNSESTADFVSDSGRIRFLNTYDNINRIRSTNSLGNGVQPLYFSSYDDNIAGTFIFNGNVGVGTTTPSARLAVTGSGTGTTRAFAIADSSNIEKLTVLDNGNVGIGAAAPTTLLQVSGSGQAEASIITTDTTGNARLSLRNDLGTPGTIFVNGSATANTSLVTVPGSLVLNGTASASGGTYILSSNTSGKIVFATGGSANSNERMRIDSSGNIGIGTTTPPAKLTVAGAGTGTGIHLMTTDSTGSPILTALDNGFVGLGTSTPSARLHLVGNTTATGEVLIDVTSNSRAPNVVGRRARGTFAAPTVAQSGDTLFFLQGRSFDGTGYFDSGQISIESDGTTGTGDVPGRIVFSTTLDGASSLTERMRIDNAGNVGVGTTSPSAAFAVQGDGLFSGNISAANIIATGTATITNLTVSGNTTYTGTGTTTFNGDILARGISAWQYLNAPFIQATSTTATSTFAGSLAVGGQQFVVDRTTGRVGIGTAAPASTLSINGGVALGTYSTSQTVSSGNVITSGALAIGDSNINSGRKLTIAGGHAYFGDQTKTLISLNSSGSYFGTIQNDSGDTWSLGYSSSGTNNLGTPVFTWKGNGNVGIGTTSPWAQLSVNPNGVSGPSLAVGSSTKTDFVVTNGGLVGIGTGNPQEKLHLFAPSGTLRSLLQNTSASGYSEYQIKSDVSDVRFGVGGSSATGLGGAGAGYFLSVSSVPLQFGTANTERMRITPSGNIGIGTTTPNSALNIAGTAPKITLSDMTSFTNGKHFYMQSNQGHFILSTTSDALADASYPAFMVGDFGRVGIGMSAPTAMLHVTGNTNTPVLKLNSQGVNGSHLWFQQDSSNAAFMGVGGGLVTGQATTDFSISTQTGFGGILFATNGASERMRIDASGNVGIGITNPLGKLHVSGSNTQTYFASGSAGIVTGTGGADGLALWENAVTGASYIGSLFDASIGTLNFVTHASSASNNIVAMTIKDSNVGIGTTTPGTKLDIKDGPMRITGSYGTPSNGGQGLEIGYSSTYGQIHSYDRDASAWTQLRIDGLTTVINSGSGGNVGIGTTSPYAKLSVVGSDNSSAALVVRGLTAGDFMSVGSSVGIGLLNPAAKLDVVDVNVGGSSSGGTVLKIGSTVSNGTAGSGPKITFYGSNISNAELAAIRAYGNGAADFGLAFDTGVTTPTTKMLITPGGSVGIGTTSPWGQLSVNPSALGSGVPEFVVGSSTATHFIVNGSGAVGIGTTSPMELFAVGDSGTTNTGSFVVASTSMAYTNSLGNTTFSGKTFINAVNTSSVGIPISASLIVSNKNDKTAGGQTAGLITDVYDSSTNTSAHGTLTGLNAFTTHSSLNTLTIGQAYAGTVTNSTGGFTMSNMVGTNLTLNNGAPAGTTAGATTTAMTGYRVFPQNNSATSLISTLKYFEAPNLFNSGTITDTYGFYVGDITTGTQTDTPYSFYASDSNAYNYFSGNTGIGTSSPSVTLSVGNNSNNQSAYFSNAVSIGTTDYAGGLLNVYEPNNAVSFVSTSAGNHQASFAVRNASDSTGWGVGFLAQSGNFAIANSAGNLNINPVVTILPTSGGARFGIGTTSPSAHFSVGSDNEAGNAYFTGNVGIGVASAGARLHIYDISQSPQLLVSPNSGKEARFSTKDTSSSLGWSFGQDNNDSDKFKIASSPDGLTINTRLTVDTSGNVGVGTTNTSGVRMTVYGGGQAAFDWGDSSSIGRLTFSGTTAIVSALAGDLSLRTDSTDRVTIKTSTGNVGIGTTSPTALLGLQGAIGVSSNQLYLASLGNVGIGTAAPTSALQVAADHPNEGSDHTSQIMATGATDANMRLMLGYDTTDNNAYIQSFWHHNGATTLALQTQGGGVGIATTSAPSTLTVTGSGCFSQGAGSATLKCGSTAGNIYYTTANTGAYDVAENYTTTDITVAAGDIVKLDPNADLSVMKAVAGEAVFGIVSTAPGMVLGGADAAIADATTTRPIALSGRVPVKVVGENGPISIGDPITVSSVPGVGMKALGSQEQIGIALEAWSGDPTDMGTIKVFVSQKQRIDASNFTIAPNGNVGIGSTSPMYKLSVGGDVAATSFVNVSTRAAKTDISYLDENAKENILDQITSLNIAQYRYKDEDQSDPLRLGLIAEEAPKQVLAAGGKGVDIYKLSTFALAGIQEQQKQIRIIQAAQASTTSDVSATTLTVSSTTKAITDAQITIFDLVGLTKEQGDKIAEIQTRLDTLAAQLGSLGTTTASLQASLLALQTRVDALQNGQTASVTGSTTSSSASELASSTPFIQAVASAVQSAISAMGEWTVAKLSSTIVYADRVEAKTVAVTQGFDITDQATGTVWCVTIKNGDWTKVPWACNTPAQNVAAAAGAQGATYTEPIIQTSTANVTQTNVPATQNAYTAPAASSTTGTASTTTSTSTATSTVTTTVQPDQTATTTAATATSTPSTQPTDTVTVSSTPASTATTTASTGSTATTAATSTPVTGTVSDPTPTDTATTTTP